MENISLKSETSKKPNFTWYEHLWLALPIGLVAVGGAIGGGLGGGAWALNRAVFQKTTHPVLRYVWTGLISLAAVVAWLLCASIIYVAIHKSRQP